MEYSKQENLHLCVLESVKESRSLVTKDGGIECLFSQRPNNDFVMVDREIQAMLTKYYYRRCLFKFPSMKRTSNKKERRRSDLCLYR